MCFVHHSVGKCFGLISFQPADYSGVLALVCVQSLCAAGCVSIHIYVLCPHMSGFKDFCPQCSRRLNENLCNLNHSYSALIAQTYLGGWVGVHPPHEQSSKHLVFCWGIITVAPVYTRPAWIKTKQDTLGDLIRLALPHRLTAALSHSPLFVSVKELVQTYGGGVCGELSSTLTLVSSAGRFLL